MKIPREPGCYILNHRVTGKFYIGSTSNLYRRYQQQLTSLRLGVNHNLELQRLFDSDDHFDYEWLVSPDRDHAYDIEQHELDRFLNHPDCINVLNDARKGWKRGTMPVDQITRLKERNTTVHADNKYRLGMRSTEETKERQRTSMRESYRINHGGPIKRPERPERLGARKPKSDETRQRMKLASIDRGLKLSKPVSICGVVYPNARTASEELGYSRRTIIVRISDDRFPDWFHVSHGEVNSISVL
jgi:hypothetical protein